MSFKQSLRAVAAASVLAMGLPSAANAATFFSFDGEDGVFGNSSVTDATFSDTFMITTEEALGLLSATISSISSNAATDINFTSVSLNGNEFDILSTGVVEFRSLSGLIVAEGLQTLIVEGTSGGNGSYSGTLAFAAVPEPATWAFMIFGFGAIGGAMRRSRKANVQVSFA